MYKRLKERFTYASKANSTCSKLFNNSSHTLNLSVSKLTLIFTIFSSCARWYNYFLLLNLRSKNVSGFDSIATIIWPESNSYRPSIYIISDQFAVNPCNKPTDEHFTLNVYTTNITIL